MATKSELKKRWEGRAIHCDNIGRWEAAHEIRECIDEIDDLRHSLSDDEFAVLLEMFMIELPPQLSSSANDIIRQLLDRKSRERGYGSWVEAYHETSYDG